MGDLALGFAFTAGLFAAFNPCGIAMLPSYVAFILGLDRRGGGMGWVRALAAGLVMTLGFVLIFSVVGLVFGGAGQAVVAVEPWLSAVVGVALVALGVVFLLGYSPGMAWASRLSGRVRGPGGGAGYWGLLGYGAVYALISLGCTLPIFLVVTAQAFVSGAVLGGLLVLLAYAAGMGVVVTGVTIVAALAGDWLSANLGKAIPVVKKVSGLVIVGAGVYIIYSALV